MATNGNSEVPTNANSVNDNLSNEVITKPTFGDAISEWRTFTYKFVDKLGERRPLPGVIEVDLCKIENGVNHRTNKFHLMKEKNNQLVVRRGQNFRVKVSFDTEFNAETDYLRLLFQMGKYPMISQGTEILIPVTPPGSNEIDSKWKATMSPLKGNEITIYVTTPEDCIIGIWSMEFQTVRKEDVHSHYEGDPIMTRFQSNSVYILFNAWNQKDSVYMENETWRREYVLNDIGKIWRGVSSSFRPCVWNFGQYEKDILDACMVLLDWARLRPRFRASPVNVSRTVSAMVNANDDRGIIVGNWSGDYADGTPPTDWQGSVKILHEWYEGSGSPVCYGQCWVFSGVTTTVMRALGIPCRSVTNFASAHDTDSSITIDYYINEKGKNVKDMCSDSVWNFHVWNDCWMMREDLPKGYGGWQAIDATPQEMSGGFFRTGPTSLVAVRRGEVCYQYDTAFVFAEVNADKVYWLYRGKEEPLKFIDLERDGIGKNISTRKIGPLLRGNLDREDITDQYKLPEMSEEERISVMNAVCCGQSSSRSIYQKQELADVFCELQVKEEIDLGQDFHVKVKVQNKSEEKRTVKACVRVDAMQYNGIIVKKVAKDYSEIKLPPMEEKLISVQVRANDYVFKLQDQGSMLMSVMLHVKETGQVYHAEDDFRIRFPDISVWVQGKMCVGRPSKVHANFVNPLNITLSRPKFIFEGPGLEIPTEIRIPNVGARQKAEASWDIIPKEEGSYTILVSFTSLQLRDIDGSADVDIHPK